MQVGKRFWDVGMLQHVKASAHKDLSNMVAFI